MDRARWFRVALLHAPKTGICRPGLHTYHSHIGRMSRSNSLVLFTETLQGQHTPRDNETMSECAKSVVSKSPGAPLQHLPERRPERRFSISPAPPCQTQRRLERLTRNSPLLLTLRQLARELTTNVRANHQRGVGE